MNFWLRFLLGLDEGEVPQGGDCRWEFSGLPQGPALLAALILLLGTVLFIILLYRKEHGLKGWQRLLLSALRLGALALVIWILLNPRVITETHVTRPGKTLLLFDTSLSMAQNDSAAVPPPGGSRGGPVLSSASRSAQAFQALQKSRLVRRLEEKNRVQLYTFDGALKPASAIDSLDDVAPAGEETRLGEAIGQAVQEAGSDPLAAVVVVSDGRSNAGPGPLELLAGPIEKLRVPIHAAAAGREQALKNIAVTALSAPEVTEVGFPLQLEGKVRITGIRAPVKAALKRSGPKGKQKTLIEERKIEPAGLVFETQLKFVDIPPEKGTYRYSLEILPALPEETSNRDNQREAAVKAAEETCRLLLVAGSSSPEFIFLKNFAIRDDGIQASCWLSAADPGYPQDGDIVLKKPPGSAEDLRPYDVVVLLDPEPASLPPALHEGLKDFVADQGGGLVFVAGEANTLRIARDQSSSRLVALLPVGFEGPAAALPKTWSQPWRPQLTAQGLAHPLCRLANDPEANQKLWSTVPPFYFSYPARQLRPAAVALLKNARGDIVLAVQQPGLGEVVYLGTDDVNRLRSLEERAHERFWAGIIRYLAMGKKRIGKERLTVEVDRDRYALGGAVRITAHLFDAGRKPVEAPRAEVTVERLEEGGEPKSPGMKDGGRQAGGSGAGDGPDGGDGPGAGKDEKRWRLDLAPAAGTPGQYTGAFRPLAPGPYQITDGSEAKAFFMVDRVSTERGDPSPDFATLEALAKQTGGSFVTLEGIGSLPGRIPSAAITEVIGRRASTVWDSAALMLLFGALLILEWALRKLWHLN